MGASQSQEADGAGGTSPTKSPTKAAAAPTGGSKMNSDAAAFLPAASAATVPTAMGGGEKAKKEAPTGSQICVRNLSKDAKEEDLRKEFEGFGKITDVSLKTLKFLGSLAVSSYWKTKEVEQELEMV
ncbi:unnamed protein product [Cladocopium goreaui]|uniref:RRM domain-containing protein n=1 Tax=Cladocopium goreaui TaxID=2562237 RepID=A0A9P1DQ01_9DINO|nr:unnamed protein product [Cladocopium goreaui]